MHACVYYVVYFVIGRIYCRVPPLLIPLYFTFSFGFAHMIKSKNWRSEKRQHSHLECLANVVMRDENKWGESKSPNQPNHFRFLKLNEFSSHGYSKNSLNIGKKSYLDFLRNFS